MCSSAVQRTSVCGSSSEFLDHISCVSCVKAVGNFLDMTVLFLIAYHSEPDSLLHQELSEKAFHRMPSAHRHGKEI